MEILTVQHSTLMRSFFTINKLTLWYQQNVKRTLEACDDVYAMLINVLLFGGGLLVKEEEMDDESSNSSYKVDGKYMHRKEMLLNIGVTSLVVLCHMDWKIRQILILTCSFGYFLMTE